MHEITNDIYKKQILFLLNNYWTGNSDFYFPVQNAIFIEKKYVYKLENFKYFTYIKDILTDKRAVLFLYKNKDNKNETVIIFSDLRVFSIYLETGNEDYYRSSIFDISYNEEENKIIFYDCFMISGNKINFENFSRKTLIV